jgi:hypothetical protein
LWWLLVVVVVGLALLTLEMAVMVALVVRLLLAPM